MRRKTRDVKPKTLALVSLGCAKNAVDLQVRTGNLLKRGWTLSADPDRADAVIVNAENADKGGTGLTAALAAELLQSGLADAITTGNHCFRRADAALYEENERVLCPANFPGLPRSCGCCTLDLGRWQLDVYNLQGTAFLEPLQNPFLLLDELIAAGTERISSGELGSQMGLTPSQIRQDFSFRIRPLRRILLKQL
mgnify:CR=1 FL=1